MKYTIKVMLILGGLLFALSRAAQAQTTNSVLTVNIALTGFKQDTESTVKAVRIDSKSVIDSLRGLVTYDTDTNGVPVATNTLPTFARNARLIAFFTDNGPVFFIRETSRGVNTDTDVSRFFYASAPDGVGSTRTKYKILTFSFNNTTTLSFTVDGLMMENKGTLRGRNLGAQTGVTVSFNSRVAGTGTIGTDGVVVSGTITGGGATLDVK
jgi:hypothetical protein